jgi:protein-L-isoaspartate(D-aspartate) O-methyltransferase
MAAMAEVPRHLFVPDQLQDYAYLDRPLPIGHGKTISQPFIVALMTDLLELRSDETVLEVGTGLGYQTAILSRLAHQVYSVEKIADLANQARQRLASLAYDNIEIRVGDGYDGWPQHAPYDKVIVTAAPPQIPATLLEQLKPGGRLVLPVGSYFSQQLLLLSKNADGSNSQKIIIPVLFSPLEEGELNERS